MIGKRRQMHRKSRVSQGLPSPMSCHTGSVTSRLHPWRGAAESRGHCGRDLLDSWPSSNLCKNNRQISMLRRGVWLGDTWGQRRVLSSLFLTPNTSGQGMLLLLICLSFSQLVLPLLTCSFALPPWQSTFQVLHRAEDARQIRHPLCPWGAHSTPDRRVSGNYQEERDVKGTMGPHTGGGTSDSA